MPSCPTCYLDTLLYIGTGFLVAATAMMMINLRREEN